jgi:hypothetical protein
MRLPVIGEDYGKIDEVEAIRVIRYAVDHGVNYVDTAYPYHGGNSETVVGKALQDGYREKVRVATKMPIWRASSQADMDKIFQEQLTKLQTDYIDFYLLHSLNKDHWTKIQNLNALEWAEKNIKDHKIRYLGFSFHDEYEVFKQIVDGYDGWAFCQIQYNYMDAEYQAGTKGLKYAAAKGLGVVVMEPIAGGNLAVTPPKEIQSIWDEAETKRTPAEWALQWVWNQPEVSVVLSGMSTMQQVVENVESASRSGVDVLTQKEMALISRVKEKYLEYGFIGCTGCRYCQPCPHGVVIPEIFALLNQYYVEAKKGQGNKVIDAYNMKVSPENGAKRCAKCGECEDKCPQKLPIRKLIASAAGTFEGKK